MILVTIGLTGQNSLVLILIFSLFSPCRATKEPKSKKGETDVKDVENDSLSPHKLLEALGVLEISVQYTNF